MHILTAFAVLAALVWFALGQSAARFFVGVLLGLGAAVVFGLISLAALDFSRPVVKATVPMGHWGSSR